MYLGIDIPLGIAFIAKHQYLDALITVIICLSDPVVLQVIDRGSLREIIDHDDAIRPFIVCRGDGPKSLLARSVPYLELDGPAVLLDGLEPE